MILEKGETVKVRTVYDNLIGNNGQQRISLWEDAQIHFDGHQGSILRDIFFKNQVPGTTKDIILTGSNIRVDNIRLMGCRLVLKNLQNSQITGLLVTDSLVEGVLVSEGSANCTISGTIKRNQGYGILIDGPKIRSIYVHGMPIEENILGQALVNDISPWGEITFTGRLNSVEANGPPLTIRHKENRVYWERLEIRNRSNSPDCVIL